MIFTPAPGQKLDESFGPSTRLQVTASPPELLVAGSGATVELSRELVIADGIDVAYCRWSHRRRPATRTTSSPPAT